MILDIPAGFDNTYTTTTDGFGNPIPRTGSPERSLSRSGSPSRHDTSMVQAADVDPEAVRLALRDFVNQLATAERERVGVHFPAMIVHGE